MDAKQIIQAGLVNIQKNFERALEGLTPAELQWHPLPDANSIGLILFHMARSEDSFIQFLIQHKTPIWEADKWCDKLGKDKSDSVSHYTAEKVDSFSVPDLKDLQQYAQAGREKTLEFLEGITPAKLDEKVDLPPLGPSPSSGQGG